jgi:hypothetical protein
MEPRSTARARRRIRPIAEPGLSIIIGHVMPLFRHRTADIARAIAAFNLSARIDRQSFSGDRARVSPCLSLQQLGAYREAALKW